MSEVAAEIGAPCGPVARTEATVPRPRVRPEPASAPVAPEPVGPAGATSLADFAELLPGVDDGAFATLAARVVASADPASSGDAQHPRARAELIHAEAVRRHIAAGHADTCGDARFFAVAYARAARDAARAVRDAAGAVRDAAVDRSALPTPACACRVPTADDVRRAGRGPSPLAS